MSLTLQKCKFNNKNYFIYIYVDDNDKAWLRASDIAEILEYKDHQKSYNLVFDQNKRYSYELIKPEIDLPYKWQRKTVMIDESGFNQLVLKSKKEEAIEFQKWVCGDLIPTVVKYGAYISPHINNNQIAELRNKMDEKEQENIQLIQRNDQLYQQNITMHQVLLKHVERSEQRICASERRICSSEKRMCALVEKVLTVEPRVAVMPQSEELQYCFRVYQIKNNENNGIMQTYGDNYIFIRTQKRNLEYAIKDIPIEATLICNLENLPNAVSILNHLKEYMNLHQMEYINKGTAIQTKYNVKFLIDEIIKNKMN